MHRDRRLLWTVFFLVSCSLGMFAQGKPGGGGGGTGGGGTGGGGRTGGVPTTSRPTNPFPTNIPSPDIGLPSPSFLSGKVVIDDGTPITDAAVIQSVCSGNVRNEGYTDSRGSFSFDLQSGSSAMAVQEADAASQGISPVRGMSNQGGRRRDLRSCMLQAVLPGFTSQNVELASKANETGNADVGTIVLHRLAKVEGFTISATSAAAPSKARKEFEKGREDVSKSKWDSAQQHFAKAVEIYPKYAVAWNELGRVQLHKNDTAGATTSFQRSIAADGSYVSPYGGLTEIAVKGQQWKQVVELTDKLLALNPINFPQYWLDNALANYFLENFDVAEKSASRGMSVDPQHRVPRLEYLLGMILVKKHDYTGALSHVQNYLRLVPNTSDRETVEKQVAELQRLTTTSQVK